MAAVQDSSITDGKTTFFHLKRDAYNSVMTSQVTISVLCKYDPKGRHSRNEELEKLAEKLDSPNKTNRKSKQPISEDAQEESSSRAKSAEANSQQITENAEADTDPEPENAVAETQNSTTEQTLNDDQDDQSVCEVISSDQEDEETTNKPSRWYYDTLSTASTWLKINNPIFQQYMNIPSIDSPSLSDPMPVSLPLARQSQENSNNILTRNVSHIPDIVISNNAFPSETHNEDQRYKRLIAGFIKLDDLTLPISYCDPDLEAMIFLNLFPIGK
ncbi:10400_t:CDS:2, partial [Racocetra fulgida]